MSPSAIATYEFAGRELGWDGEFVVEIGGEDNDKALGAGGSQSVNPGLVSRRFRLYNDFRS